MGRHRPGRRLPRIPIRPLQILGARVLDLERVLASSSARPRPQALAVAADLFGCDSRVRQGVLQALDHGVTEVTLWGDTWPAELDEQCRPGAAPAEHGRTDVQGQALAAAAVPEYSIGQTEELPKRAAGVPVGRGRSGSCRLTDAASGRSVRTRRPPVVDDDHAVWKCNTHL